MSVYHSDDTVTLHHGDCLDVLRSLPDASVDAVVTDPPYGLEFMGKAWDSFSDGTASSKAAAGMSGTGYTDGAERLERPSFMGGTNPKCRTCDRWQRGGNPCRCDAPDFPNERRARSAAFGDWCEAWAVECLRVLKPGGHLLAFGGTRTWHRLACAIEDAGFEMRDSIAWLYGSGFPKSLDVSKAIDKLDAADERLARARRFQSWLREHVTPKQVNAATGTEMGHHYTTHPTQPSVATVAHLDMLRPILPPVPEWVEDMARQRTVESQAFASREVLSSATTSRTADGSWAGEVASGMFRDGERTVDITAPATDAAREWAGWGTALKPAFEPVVVARKPLIGTVAANVLAHGTGALNIDATRIGTDGGTRRDGRATEPNDTGWANMRGHGIAPLDSGRWPANVVLDESQAEALDEQSGTLKAPRSNGSKTQEGHVGTDTFKIHAREQVQGRADDGGASRFFYVAKAPKRERPNVDGVAHPTVKPLALMRWLVRLVTPPGGTVLEPFAGSGTTVEACIQEGFRCIAIEKGDEYLPLILERIARQDRARIEAEVTRTTDPAQAIAEQTDGQLDLLEGIA